MIWFKKKIEFSNINVDEPIDTKHNQLSSKVERWMCEGPEWTIISIIQHQLIISEIAPYERSSYFPLPKELRNPMKGLVNVQNEDNE